MRSELNRVPADQDELARLSYAEWWMLRNPARAADEDIRLCADDHDYGKPEGS